MTEETLKKYLEFLISETNKYLNKENIDEGDIDLMVNELENFKRNVIQVDLAKGIKERILALNIEYEGSGKSILMTILSYLALGGLAGLIVSHKSQKAELISKFQDLRSDLNKIYIDYLGQE